MTLNYWRPTKWVGPLLNVPTPLMEPLEAVRRLARVDDVSL